MNTTNQKHEKKWSREFLYQILKPIIKIEYLKQSDTDARIDIHNRKVVQKEILIDF